VSSQQHSIISSEEAKSTVSFEAAYRDYLGADTDAGSNLFDVLKAIDLTSVDKLTQLIQKTATQNGRVFVLGNGGSFDNALLFVSHLTARGVRAKVPGEPDRYFSTGTRYQEILARGLSDDKVRSSDLVIGLSGSGNSANILQAFEVAEGAGAEIFALGGRDGGNMARAAGPTRSLIAKTESMEGIEDAHAAIVLMISRYLRSQVSLDSLHEEFLNAYSGLLSEKNIRGLCAIGEGILLTILSETRSFVLGLGIGARHFRADAQRGFTNALPIRGVLAPEFFTTNSAMATANDDGLEFLIADGLAKFAPTANDFGVIFETAQMKAVLAPVKEVLRAGETSHVTVGPSSTADVSIQSFQGHFDSEFCVSLIGHATGVVLRDYLTKLFAVRRVSDEKAVTVALMGKKKLGIKDTKLLEALLRERSVIGADEVLTYAYGEVYAARDPKILSLSRSYF